MLEQEFSFYLKNQNSLLQKYRNKFVVIVGEEVIGSYTSNEEALYQTRKNHQLGTFLIQKCTEGGSAYTYTFHSNVINDYVKI